MIMRFVCMLYLWEEPFEDHSVVVGFFRGRGVIWIYVLCVLHHFVRHLSCMKMNVPVRS